MNLVFTLITWSYLCLNALAPASNLKYKISGIIYSHATYTAGIDYDHSKIPHLPIPNYTLSLITWKGENKIPVFVRNITANKKGEFSVNVPSGKYGFAKPGEVDSLAKGQWLPKSYQTWIGHTSTSTYWQISTENPVDLTQGPVSNLVLIFHSDSVCMDCP
jgi:hypothetical protein